MAGDQISSFMQNVMNLFYAVSAKICNIRQTVTQKQFFKI